MKVQYLVFKAVSSVYAGYDELFFEENLCPGTKTRLEIFERLRRTRGGKKSPEYFIFIKTANKVKQPNFTGLEFIFVTPGTFTSMRSTMRFVKKY
jgi:hypothetical protein